MITLTESAIKEVKRVMAEQNLPPLPGRLRAGASAICCGASGWDREANPRAEKGGVTPSR